MVVVVMTPLVAGCGRLQFDAVADAIDASDANACPPFARLCDDFESGDLARWTVATSSGATVAVDPMRSRSGRYALAATVPASFNGAFGVISQSFGAQSSGQLAVRAWVSTPVPLVDYDLVLLLENEGTSQYAGVGGETIDRWVAVENSSAGLFDYFGGVGLTLDTWTCVELVYTFGPAQLQVFVDDAVAIDVAARDPAPAYIDIQIGVARAAAAGYSVFVDDVVIASQRIGCR